MGLLDQLAGQVIGSLGAQKQDPVSQSDLLSGVMGLINNAGGLQGILQQLQSSGIADQVASWVGTGENQPVSGNQITDALGAENITQIAQHAGIEPDHAATGLAQLLPQIIDKLTPDGQVPENALLEQGMNLLRGKLFG
ncbi:Uncharacterized conserved protein YidB, DUF937 family [Pseudoduganella namucuonensis]|uniref:Uncharacterized conserved protein YidB, DUF937 family n=2 Tax=Pseudoduganella namucuonensis TaxID=1035707 RepID=A0A1I7ILM4_9BURK|nr:Uncharacterized conserved protein YidB, DUF937 family [Pseudoduganella namucuonensis]